MVHTRVEAERPTLKGERARLLGVALIALLCYVPAFWWGAPHATDPLRTQSWGVDDETPLGPLAEVSNILAPQPDRNLGYPLLYPFVVAGAYAPYMAGLLVTGGLSDPTGEYPFGLADPVRSLRVLSGIAHLVTVGFGVLCVVGAYWIGLVGWDRRTGLWTAGTVLTLYPMFYYARTGNVDVPMLAFIVLATAAFATALRDGWTPRRAAWLGVWAGCALATKEAAAGAFLLIPIASLLGLRLRPAPREGFSWKVNGTGLLASVLALGIGSGLFIEPSRYVAHLRFIGGRSQIAASGGGNWVIRTYAMTLSDSVAYAQRQVELLIDVMTLPGLLLALAGVGWVLARERDRWPLLLPVLGYTAYMFLGQRVTQLRYLLPTAVLLAPFAARLAVVGLRAAGPLARALPGVAVVALGLGALRGVDVTWAMLGDTRYEAAAWLAERTEPGDTVEHFGPFQKLPPLEAGVASRQATLYLGILGPTDTTAATTRDILDGWRERTPRFVLVVPDHTTQATTGPHSISLPPTLYRALMEGGTEYALVRTFESRPLLPWVQRPPLDYPTVSPPIRVFARRSTAAS
ncbi:MAG: glycosyltransferase family 39 protein [Gemmatimonadetes bacterium]|nr:glycosyltransferase family 39 protein [Gemmatimonadota bacterium]